MEDDDTEIENNYCEKTYDQRGCIKISVEDISIENNFGIDTDENQSIAHSDSR